jgi:polyribonucleotide nucleotidyltransferase
MEKMMSKKVFETTYFGKPLRVEVGEVALQTKGGVLVYYGDTVVLSVAVNKEIEINQDFFPLMVLYQEKQYAGGKIPGGFFRREGRPTEYETLTSRLIDRPIRPLFAAGYHDEVQVINTVLSRQVECSTQMAALFGSSLALAISEIPFLGPIAGAQVGYIDGKYCGNPSAEQLESSLVNITIAGTSKAVTMVEGSSKQVSEKIILDAIRYGQEEIVRLCAFQDEIVQAIGQKKVTPKLFTIDKALKTRLEKANTKGLVKAVSIKDKLARYEAIDKIINAVLEVEKNVPFTKQIGTEKAFDFTAQADYLQQVKMVLDGIVTKEVRRLITVDKVRPDGRKIDEIRPLSSRVGLLPRVHGSALFTRGQTQSLGTVTLASLKENQLIEDLTMEDKKRFMLHYNFPQYSVGETGRYGNPGRREIGHGALGERALLQVIPSEEEFPYTIRVVSEILESNGSSSQATICSGSLALMDAGVPIKAPVAGIAMGLIMDGEHYTILTDIQGMEDHEGDMDFKVAGTTNGVCAIQMDIKIQGITFEILEEALEQARRGRLEILKHMETTIATPRPSLSQYAPKIKMIKIKSDQIKDVIGSGGKVINQIRDDCHGVQIDIEQDGRVYVMHEDEKYIDQAIEAITLIVREPELGEVYEAKVVRIEVYGAFVRLWEGCEGLVHISALDDKRVEKVEDVVKLGDQILVKYIGTKEGKMVLSKKDALKPGLPAPRKDYGPKKDGPRRDFKPRHEH